jgi:hypothetical protein
MANLLYANNAAGTLAIGITNSQTSLTLNAGQAALFPTPTPPQSFYVTLTDAATQTLIEIVQVTAVSGNIFSIVRGQDGTTARSWAAGDIVSQRAIRLEMQGWENAAEGLFPTSAITPSTTLGIIGTTLGDNANAGSIGEYLSSLQPAGALANGVASSVISLSLTAGDWNVTGNVYFAPNGSQTLTAVLAGVSTVNNNIPVYTTGLLAQQNLNGAYGLNGAANLVAPAQRINVSATTTIYLSAEASFTGGGGCAVAAILQARRAR